MLSAHISRGAWLKFCPQFILAAIAALSGRFRSNPNPSHSLGQIMFSLITNCTMVQWQQSPDFFKPWFSCLVHNRCSNTCSYPAMTGLKQTKQGRCESPLSIFTSEWFGQVRTKPFELECTPSIPCLVHFNQTKVRVLLLRLFEKVWTRIQSPVRTKPTNRGPSERSGRCADPNEPRRASLRENIIRPNWNKPTHCGLKADICQPPDRAARAARMSWDKRGVTMRSGSSGNMSRRQHFMAACGNT